MARRRRHGRARARTTHGDPEARERAFEVLHLMRSKGRSLTAAAREARTTLQTVRKHVPTALRRSPGGRYAATHSDRYTRRVYFLPKRVARSSRSAMA